VNKAERYRKILEYFETNQPVAETELVYSNPYELMVSVILSAQCTDKRVNMITPAFFTRFPTVESLAAARKEEVFELIKSCSYPNNKTGHLVGMAAMVVEHFGGEIPADVEALQKLPGVGRKTANVIASVAFNQPKMAVDTHVHRVAARLGLTNRAKNPLQTELQLVRHIPERQIPIAHHWLILHGRYVCQARKPKCDVCGLSTFCRYFNDRNKNKLA
jgi:endonuclease-3